MRVLVVVNYYLPHIGGLEEVVRKQVQSLTALGHDVTVLTCRPDTHSPLWEERDGYTIIRVKALNGIERKFGVPFTIISPLVFFRLLREVRSYDIVHIHEVFYTPSHFAALACWLRGKAFYLTQHVAMVDHPSAVVMAVQRGVYGTIGGWMFRQAKKIICYNMTVRKFLLGSGAIPEKVVTQYNGIDTQYFTPVGAADKQQLREAYGLPTDRPLVLFVGRRVPKKGYDIVYDAQSDDYYTLIVGSGVVPPRIKSNDNVGLFGPATAEQLRDLYRMSDVFVFPAIGEIFTLVMQEAMASGLPVITTNDPGYREYEFSREHVRLVLRDKVAVKRAIEEMTARTNEPARQAAAVYSRNFAVQYFDWQQNYPREYAAYEEIQDTSL